MGDFQSTAQILGRMRLLPNDEDWKAKPQPALQKCEYCHKDFLAGPQWFGTGWKHANVCPRCGDWPGNVGGHEPLHFWDKVVDPKIRKFDCPGCGIVNATEAAFEIGLWTYWGQCSYCGVKWRNTYRLARECDSCGDNFFVDEEHPTLECRDCKKGEKKREKTQARKDPYKD
jgi:hypothetical protein